jgi:hypothetical protein
MLKSKLLASAASVTGLATTATLAMGLMVAAPTPAQANVCPVITDTQGFGASDCNVLLTINADGSVTATNPAGVSTYDGSDDAMIGILNNSSTTLNHILVHGSAAFGGSFGGMDGDGICETSRFSGAACGSSPQNTTFDYAPDGITLTAISATDGYVDIAGGLAPGQGLYFSLEAPASISSITISTPEPATLTVLGVAIAALGLRRRSRKS